MQRSAQRAVVQQAARVALGLTLFSLCWNSSLKFKSLLLSFRPFELQHITTTISPRAPSIPFSVFPSVSYHHICRAHLQYKKELGTVPSQLVAAQLSL